MKAQIEQLKKTFNESIELLKEQKTDDAIAKMAEAAPIFKELETAEAQEVEKITKSEDELKKTQNLLTTTTETLQKTQDELKKWADMFVSADNVQQLLQDLGTIKEFMKTSDALQKKVEDLEKVALSKQAGGGSEVKKTTAEVLDTIRIG